MHYTLVRGSSDKIWKPYGNSKQIDLWLTPADPCMTFDPCNALHSGQGFFQPNLVAIGHFKANWPLVDSGWSLCDLWPQQTTTLLSGVLLTKFGSHRAFLRQIDLWMTFELWWNHFENMISIKPWELALYPHAKFQLRTLKHDETHSQTNMHVHTPIQTPLS